MYAVEIVERFRIRAKNLESILADDLALGNKLYKIPQHVKTNFSETFALENIIHQQQFDLHKQERSEDVECWRDMTRVMESFLTTFESLEQSKARGKFLNGTEAEPFYLQPDHDDERNNPNGQDMPNTQKNIESTLLHGRQEPPGETYYRKDS